MDQSPATARVFTSVAEMESVPSALADGSRGAIGQHRCFLIHSLTRMVLTSVADGSIAGDRACFYLSRGDGSRGHRSHQEAPWPNEKLPKVGGSTSAALTGSRRAQSSSSASL